MPKRKPIECAREAAPKKKCKLCIEGECPIYSSFNYEGQAISVYCKVHAKPNMINVRFKQCEKCNQRPVFNYEGEMTAKYCAKHKEANMVNVMAKRCVYCNRQPYFNYEGLKTGKYCSEHKEPDMINVRDKRCVQCNRHPHFNYEGSMTGKYCSIHKEAIMVDVKSKRCVQCNRYPNFNYEGELSAKYCAKHKKSNMINVKSKRCVHCNRQPLFNYEGSKTGKYCAKHKKSNMINVKSKRCVQCNRQPIFNYEGSKTGKYCVKHKEPGMVNVTSKRCEKCCTIPGYGMPGNPPTVCAKHKRPGDIAHPKRKCEECKEFAIYGMDSIPKFCETHKSDQHMNLVHHDCVVCGVLEITDTEGKCSRCSEYMKKRLYCRKQRLVKAWIDTSDLLKYESYDKQLDGGSCGKERPDFMWDAITHKVILEVDEDQHKDRPCECEQTRMANLTNSIGMPCVWIRFNPDAYKGQGKVTDAIRKDILIRTLKEYLQAPPNGPSDFCRVIHLFFDGFQVGCPIGVEVLPML